MYIVTINFAKFQNTLPFLFLIESFLSSSVSQILACYHSLGYLFSHILTIPQHAITH